MKLEEYLQRSNVKFEKHTHPVAYTAQQLADAEHVTGFMVAKPVIVKGATDFAMCVIAAPDHLDLKSVAGVLGEKAVRLATEPEMADLFPDCELGAEPPFGPMFNLRTVADARLENDVYLVMQAGTHSEAVKLRLSDWKRVCKPLVAGIVVQ
ncbi:MAG: deacylase [Myxococcales bacterium]|nr:MAG: deacylase [Myxococcales bacterium]